MSNTITIYDIAAKLGISTSTVSKALNGRPDVSRALREKVLQEAAALGYSPNVHARSLKMKKSWLVGVLYGTEQVGSFEHPLFLPIINAFKERIESYGYELLFLSQSSQFRGDSLLNHAFRRQVDGLLLLNVSQHVIQTLLNSSTDIPVVSCDTVIPSIPSILTDNFIAGIQAVKFFYNLGHRDIGHIAGPTDSVSQAGIERFLGYKQGLQLCNLPYNENLVVTATEWTPQAGQKAMEILLERNISCSAIFCSADFYIMGLQNVCRRNGLHIPDDISVIGFDDVQWTEYVDPGFTTFRQNKEALGSIAADTLNSCIDGIVTELEQRIPATLIVRGSVKEIVI